MESCIRKSALKMLSCYLFFALFLLSSGGSSVMEPLQLIANATTSKKRKKLMWNLKSKWISGLLQIMCEYVDANPRSAQGFKDVVYRVAQKMKLIFGIEVTTEHCKNQIRLQRFIWSHIQYLKKKSGVSCDDEKKMIIMGPEEYTSHIQAFGKDAAYLDIPITNYMELEKVCGEGHATGEWTKLGSSQTSFGSQRINLDDDESSHFMEIEVDASQAHWDNIEVK